VGNIREDRQFVDDRMHLTVGGTELTLDNSGLVCVHISHDLNSKARHTREMITAFLGRRKRLVWLLANPEVIHLGDKSASRTYGFWGVQMPQMPI
jgi:hypothetical protein